MAPRRIWVELGAIALAVTALGGDARAGDKASDKKAEKEAEKKACVEAHAGGQALVREGKLQAAREQFIACGRETCPGALRKDCTQWLGEANENQPSVVIGAKDEQGHDTTAVRVLVDGKEVATMLDGRPLEIDPGTHALHYELKSGKTLEEQVLIRQGEKNRKLTAVFPRAPVPPKPFELPMLVYVFGGIGLGAASNFAIWGILGKNKQSELEDECAPRCSQKEADAMRRDYLLADLSLGIAVAAIGAAVVLGVTSRSSEPSPPPAAGLVLRPRGAGIGGAF